MPRKTLSPNGIQPNENKWVNAAHFTQSLPNKDERFIILCLPNGSNSHFYLSLATAPGEVAVQTLKLAAFTLPSSYHEGGSASHTNLRWNKSRITQLQMIKLL